MIQICAVETEHGCICYQLERKNVRNINLRIRTDASVYVSAPKDVSESVVTQFVKRRSRYIAEAQQLFREFRQYAPQPRQTPRRCPRHPRQPPPLRHSGCTLPRCCTPGPTRPRCRAGWALAGSS